MSPLSDTSGRWRNVPASRESTKGEGPRHPKKLDSVLVARIFPETIDQSAITSSGSHVSSQPMFGNWLVALAEAVAVTGASDVDTATAAQMTQAWGLVRQTAELSDEDLAKSIAEQAELGVADLDAGDERTAVLIPSEVAHRRNLLPLRCDDTHVWVATGNPLSQDARREVAELTGRTVVFEVAPPGGLAERVDAVYGSMSEEELARSASAPRVTERPKGPHVLVVDDEVGQRTLFRSVLEEAGYRVDVAEDGPAAVELLSGDPSYDLITLDYWMDKMNGLRVLQHIRSDREIGDMPVIMVTGANDRQIEMSLFEAGADDYIAKPIDAPLFVLRIQAVLRRRGYR